MATKPPPRIDIAAILNKRGYGAEVARRAKDAVDSLGRSQTLLSPTDVAGEYDAARLLKTTLGGQIRYLTADDLRAFQDSARKLGKKFKGGITARGVIDASLPIDRQRSNQQIRTAVVVKAHEGVMHFITNAGPESKDVRHHVHVEFPAFKAYAASPQKADVSARSMLQGKLKLGCDCGRAKFWYDYIATIGGFKYAQSQPNFPKIRNPKLAGVACKHQLRVMQAVLSDANAKIAATKMISAAQQSSAKAHTITAAEAKAIAQKQLAQSHHVKNRAETTKEIAARRSKSTAGKVKAIETAAKEAQRRAEAARKAGRAQMDRDLANLKRIKGLTPDMRTMLEAQIRATYEA